MGCSVCGLAQRVEPPEPGQIVACVRCGDVLAQNRPRSASRTLAFALAALILYVPANILPIMTFDYYGATRSNTVWSGVVALTESSQWAVAAVVFLASMVVPLLKLSILFFLSLSVRWRKAQRFRTDLYRFIQAVGTWAMLDVFLVAILVAIVKMGQLASVRPGPGVVPFCFVVVFTLLATENFDPKLLWLYGNSERRPSA
jgi:paraquat-inducible protein A